MFDDIECFSEISSEQIWQTAVDEMFVENTCGSEVILKHPRQRANDTNLIFRIFNFIQQHFVWNLQIPFLRLAEIIYAEILPNGSASLWNAYYTIF